MRRSIAATWLAYRGISGTDGALAQPLPCYGVGQIGAYIKVLPVCPESPGGIQVLGSTPDHRKVASESPCTFAARIIIVRLIWSPTMR